MTEHKDKNNTADFSVTEYRLTTTEGGIETVHTEKADANKLMT